MRRNRLPYREAALAAVSTALLLTAVPAWTQGAGAVKPARSAAPATVAAACTVNSEQARLDQPLPQVAARLAAGRPIRIVAIGSSSTFGAGASSRSNSYPNRLEVELGRHFPGHPITVLNRGANGEEAPEMLARFNSDVIDERPHLVLWQVGTNALLRDRPLEQRATVLRDGLARLKAIRKDVVLIDPQFAPKVIAKANVVGTVAQIADTATDESVGVFRRFAMMKRWHEVDGMPFDAFVSPDGLHLNDWGYGCWAKWLGVAIADAATRSTTAVAGRPSR
jgi:lysophospholipase L1-like esterase